MVGPTGPPAILAGNSSRGWRHDPPVRATAAVPGFQPAGPASRTVAGARGDPGRGGDRDATAVGRLGWKAYADRRDRCARVPRRRASRRSAPVAPSRTRPTCSSTPPTGCGRSTRSSSSPRSSRRVRTSQGVRQLLRAEAGDDRAGSRRDSRWNGMPLSCHLMLTAATARTLGLLSPGDADPAGRPVHDRVRHLGSAQLPRGVRGRGRGRTSRRRSGTTSSAWSARTSRRSPSGTRRCASARPAARSTRSSTAASATHSSASSSTPATRSTSTSGSTRRSRRDHGSSCGRGWRSRWTSSRRPAPSTSRRNRGRDRARR